MCKQKKFVFAQSNSTNQSDNLYVNSISKTTKMSQTSAMKGESVPKTLCRTSRGVSFTTDTISNTPRQSPSNSFFRRSPNN